MTAFPRPQSAANAGAAQAKLVAQVESDAEAYESGITRIPLEVRETVRAYDSSGHLKSTRSSSYPYAIEDSGETPSGTRKTQPSADRKPEQPLRGATLEDGVTLPFVFLPSSIGHLALDAETPGDGPWILYFKSSPCPKPTVRHGWLGANIDSQCVEGSAYIDPQDGAITRIRMRMGGLPLFFRSRPIPLEVEVYQLYDDVTFRRLPRGAGASPQLVPQKAEYVFFTSRGRTVIDRDFKVAAASPPAATSPSR